MSANKGNLTRTKLALEVADLLQLPRRGRKGEAYKIVSAIFKTITTSLLSGERVSIDGFGIFELKPRNAGARYHRYYFNLTKNPYSELVELPEGYKVIFKPSKVLKRMLKEYDTQSQS